MTEMPLLGIYSRQIKIYVCKNLHKNEHSNFVHNCLKLEATKILNLWQIHTTKCNSEIKNEKLLISTTNRKITEIFVLRERSRHGVLSVGFHLYKVLEQNLPAVCETWVRSLAWEDPLEKEMATHSSTLAWRIPWTEEPGGLQSIGSQRVRHK